MPYFLECSIPASANTAGIVPDPNNPSLGIPFPPPAPPNRPFPICSTPTASTTSYKSALIEVHASLKAVAPVAQAFEQLTTGIPVCPIS